MFSTSIFSSSAVHAVSFCSTPGCEADGPIANRPLASEEETWCKSIAGGSGLGVVGWTFSGKITMDQVRTAADSLTALYPVLAARVFKTSQSKKSAMELHVCRPPQPITLLQRSWADVRAAQSEAGGRMEEDLVTLMEADVNIPVASSAEAPIDMMQIHVYPGKNNTSVILRIHIIISDRMSTREASQKFLTLLAGAVAGQKAAPFPGDIDGSHIIPCAMADRIPQQYLAANKSMLTQAYDALGHIRKALAASMLPFEAATSDIRKNQFRTNIVPIKLNKRETAAVLKACEKNGLNLCSLLCATALHTTAKTIKLGGKPETFTMALIHDSRNELEKPTNKAPLGSYVSMLGARMTASEESGVWDLARDVAGQAGEVLEMRKNFTDVAVLELLFTTILKNPALSRGAAQRTGLCTALHYAPFHLDWQADADREAAGRLRIEETAGPCVNMHGAGPCFCFPDTLIDGELTLFFSFATPLYSRQKMEAFAQVWRNELVTAPRHA